MRVMSRRTIMLIAMFLLLAPSSVWAYSYGDPNQEELAATFNLVIANIGESNWEGAIAAHEARRAEIASHFGEPVAKTLDENFASRNEDETIANYKGLLVLNLERRFKFAKQGINDYTQAKLLLAKARATFDTLKPYMADKLPTDKIAGLEGRFDEALTAIGNPGLFGVGKQEVNPQLLAASVDAIYAEVAPLFPFKGAEGTPPQDGGNIPSQPADKPGQGHAPMKQTDKTNPAVTVGVIGAVLVIGGGAVWWARRRGLF